jgi:hypothetical protein
MDIAIYLLLIVLHIFFLIISLRIPLFALFNIILLLFSIGFVMANSPITQFIRQCGSVNNTLVCNNYEHILIDNPYSALILVFIFIFQLIVFFVKIKL